MIVFCSREKISVPPAHPSCGIASVAIPLDRPSGDQVEPVGEMLHGWLWAMTLLLLEALPRAMESGPGGDSREAPVVVGEVPAPAVSEKESEEPPSSWHRPRKVRQTFELFGVIKHGP